jgi:hypothetical protein
MLDLDEPHRITTVELFPPEQRPAVDALKLSIVDVKCTDARGITYVVEMQVLQVEGFEKRVVYNVTKAYVNQISRGDLHPSLDDVVGITICDFPLWPDEGERKVPMLSRWAMTEQQSGRGGLRDGREEGLRSGREEGLRYGVEAVCRALRTELTHDRQRELSALDMAGLQALLTQLETHGRWD